MKIKNSWKICIFIFSLILLVGCVRKEEKIIYCNDSFSEDCVCPEGQKQINTMGGIGCVDESFCLDYKLSDNESACVGECPFGYIPLIVTDVYHAGTCINIKEINKDNCWIYARYLLRTSNLSFMKRYNGDCWIVEELELKNLFEIKLKCRGYPENCSFYIYPDATFEDAGCSGN